jgi:small subunit ribosomal protein S21
MKKQCNFKVTSKECRGNVERMIRKFIRKTKKEGVLDEVRERRYYEKPSVTKRKKSEKARRLRARQEQKRLRAKERRYRKK